MGDYSISVVKDSFEVKVGQNTYTLTGINDRDLPLVKEHKNKLLMQINLKEMLSNLLNSVNLLDIVYCSVAGVGRLPGQVSKLQTGLLRDISQSQIVMSSFVTNTEAVLDQLIDVYPELSYGEYEDAIDILVNVKNYAERMRDQAQELKSAFEKRTEESDGILTQAIDTNSQMYEQRDKIQQELLEMQAELAAFETLKEILNEQITQMNEEYQKLEKQEQKAADRAFGMELAGVILGGIGELVSAAVPVKELARGVQDSESKAGSKPEQAQEAPDEEVEENSRVKEKEQKVKKLEEKKEKLEQDISDLEKQLKECKPGDEYNRLRADADSKKKELEEVSQELEMEKKTAEKVKSALKSAGSGFSDAAQKQQDSVEFYNKRLQEIYRLRQEVQKQDADNKAKIKEYTTKIAGTVSRKDEVDLAVKSLTMAIGSLRRVVVILNETVMFWESIVQCCKALAGSDLADRIRKGCSKAISDGAQPFYMGGFFVKTFLTYLMQWTALNLISCDYVAAMNTVRKELGSTIAQEEGVREVQWEKAAQLAKNLRI